MANKIYLVSKSTAEIITNNGKKYSHVMGIELRDGTSGAVVPAKFLQTDECTAAFVAKKFIFYLSISIKSAYIHTITVNIHLGTKCFKAG